jgi:nicotinate-nucleotide pyrophosphorylase (carboxylating)
MEILRQIDLTELIKRALAEDIGQGDITTASTVDSSEAGFALITVKEPDGIVFCGGVLLEQIFSMTSSEPTITALANEGDQLPKGAVAAEVNGMLSGLLIGERVALNFIQLMSGIATTTRRYVDAIAGTRARIVDTRKTHPGLRAIEKYAVRIGGGSNHRFGLDSGVLIKDNHIAAAGSIGAALDRARQLAPHTFRVEIECETLVQVEEAIACGATSILLDNMSLDNLRRAREIVGDKVLIEASGNVNLDTVRAIAETGVDLISVGALTHSVKAVDLSMRTQAM